MKLHPQALITSALPYANGEIHLGHISSTYLPADITTRFLRLNGVKVYHVCASDDYGTPILIQSEKEGRTPTEHAEYWNRRDLQDFESLNIRFDCFSRTSSDENKTFVQDVFNRLLEKGLVHTKEIIQFYCEKDEKFLPDRYVRGTCPGCNSSDQYSDHCDNCGTIPDEIRDPKCGICGAVPVKRPATHYFFKLGLLEDDIRTWLDRVNLHEDAANYVRTWLDAGLSDWDISRDISWGVPIPGDSGSVFYGWFDNHLAYISSTLKHLESQGVDGRDFWNSADIYHFIGKDIIYHHSVYLPAIRAAYGDFRQPDHLPVRGHLRINSKKVSKSRNWYISVREFLEKYPADYLRFYLTLITPYSQKDVNFEWDHFCNRINTELINNIGNFANRAQTFTGRSFDGIVPTRNGLVDEDKEILYQIKESPEKIGGHLAENRLDIALKEILSLSSHFNQYFQSVEPWKNSDRAANYVNICIHGTHCLSILLSPFIPESAARLRVQLNASTDFKWSDAGNVDCITDKKLGTPTPLFKKI